MLFSNCFFFFTVFFKRSIFRIPVLQKAEMLIWLAQELFKIKLLRLLQNQNGVKKQKQKNWKEHKNAHLLRQSKTNEEAHAVTWGLGTRQVPIPFDRTAGTKQTTIPLYQPFERPPLRLRWWTALCCPLCCNRQSLHIAWSVLAVETKKKKMQKNI